MEVRHFEYPKVKPPQQQNTKSSIKILIRAGNRTRDLSHPSRMRTAGPPSQLKVSVVVKLFKFFNLIGQNVNKHNRIYAGHAFSTFFPVIF